MINHNYHNCVIALLNHGGPSIPEIQKAMKVLLALVDGGA